MIRKLSPHKNEADFNALKEAYLETWNAPDALKFLSYTIKPFEEETVAAWLRASPESGVSYYAAFDPQGRIAGICLTRADPIQGFELLGLGVHPAHRRQGTGRALVAHIVEAAREAGYQAVDTDVFADNKRMLRLVLDLDFIPVRMSYHQRADGADVVHLKRYL